MAGPVAAKPVGPQARARRGGRRRPRKSRPGPSASPPRSVYVWVAPQRADNQLEQLQADGYVEVHQDPAEGDEKGVDVEGEHLDMTYHPEGNLLVVAARATSTTTSPSCSWTSIYIIGPVVNIDQAANKAWVNGPGAMEMDEQDRLQRQALDKPVPLTIHWNKEMFFTGNTPCSPRASRPSRTTRAWRARTCSVSFDRPISLKEGNHGGPPPRVKKLVCSDNVRVENRTLEGDRLIRYQRIQSTSLEMNPLEPEDASTQPRPRQRRQRDPRRGRASCACSRPAGRTRWPRPRRRRKDDGRQARPRQAGRGGSNR